MIRLENGSQFRPFQCQIHCLSHGRSINEHGIAPMNIYLANTEKSEPPAQEVFRYFEFYSISHMYDGCGFFETPNGIRTSLQAGQGVLITPGFIHYYGSEPGAFFAEDNICFYGPAADFLYRNQILTNGIIEIGSTRVLQPIIKLYQRAAELDRIEAGVRLEQLLIDIFRSQMPEVRKQKEAETEMQRFQTLLQTIESAPGMWWSIPEMCHYANIQPTRLRILFREQTGYLPKQYIDRSKIDQACHLLRFCDWPLTQIAKHFGYEDVYHFSRRFKALNGVAPDQFRRRSSLTATGSERQLQNPE